MAKLSDSTMLFSVRKILRFELTPLFATRERLAPMLADDFDRAAALFKMKAVIEAEHQSFVRRVFDSLGDPLPDNPRDIVFAARNDPEYEILHGSDVRRVITVIRERCRYSRLNVPREVEDLASWSSLHVKWHWHCRERMAFAGEKGLANQWAGKSKAEVLKTCAALKPKRRKISRNHAYEHGAYRMMFRNPLTGYGWRTDDYAKSRQFLLRDGARVLVGIVPRDSRADPFAMDEVPPAEAHYDLYVERPNEKPAFRRLAKSTIDRAAQGGGILLFEVSGRAMRGANNLNARYLRALLSDENIACPVLHLDAECLFYARGGEPFDGAAGRRDVAPYQAAFRQRFTRPTFQIEFALTCNAPRVGMGSRPMSFGAIAKVLAGHPETKVIEVRTANGGWELVGRLASGAPCPIEGAPFFVPTAAARSGRLAGLLARLVIAHDAYALMPFWLPRAIRNGILEKFNYVVLKDRAANEPGGVLRGYQINGRIVTGKWR